MWFRRKKDVLSKLHRLGRKGTRRIPKLRSAEDIIRKAKRK